MKSLKLNKKNLKRLNQKSLESALAKQVAGGTCLEPTKGCESKQIACG
ncbi:hypothetical protein ACSLBF_17870 (plasmid) [Pseudoalteromonas sp. T1lg65]